MGFQHLVPILVLLCFDARISVVVDFMGLTGHKTGIWISRWPSPTRPCMVQSPGGQVRTKRRGRKTVPFFCLTATLGHCTSTLLPLAWGFSTGSPGSQAFGLRLNYTTDFPACRGQINLQNLMSQFLILNLLLYKHLYPINSFLWRALINWDPMYLCDSFLWTTAQRYTLLTSHPILLPSNIKLWKLPKTNKDLLWENFNEAG